MRVRLLVPGLLVAAVLATGFVYWLDHRPENTQELVIYGNVDLRMVDLPFHGNERIAAVLVQEGDHVHQGQVLARLDVSRLQPQMMAAEASVAAQRAVVEKLHNGTRPEEIAQARAAVAQSKADAENARVQFERKKPLVERGAASQQDFDNARAALDMANARVESNQKALDLAIAGPRREDIAQAEAELRSDEAQLALMNQELTDAQLVAPTDAVVRSRLMEPGEMASPQRPVFSLAIVDPKWVRAYISEPDLGKIHPGESASVAVDSFPKRRFDGWIGFISPVAEFTPKAVETTELRTSLVYEVRVFVKDPMDELRLGMPATVFLPLNRGVADARGRAESGTEQ
jgi:HlyD family secretion protein